MSTKKKKPIRKRLPPPPPPVPADQAALDRARAAFAAGALGEASAQGERAAQINPRRADVPAFLATCWLKRGDHTRALEHAQQATELEPANPKWWNHLGWTRLEMRDFQEAKTAYLRAISADPRLAEAYYNLARAELALGETQVAADHLVQALTLRPGLAPNAQREFLPLASHPALSEWIKPPEEPGLKKRRRKAPPKKKRRR